MLETNKIYQGDSLTVLKTFPDESINCVMTSPPYWALRNYNVEEQLGLEPTFTEYINKLCDIFDEIKRVLRKDGTCFVNIGDTYCSKGETRHKGYGDPKNQKVGIKEYNEPSGLPQIIPEKSLCNIPARFSIEMQNRGWILRNTIIWHKPNCMPSSVKDRFTVDFEYLFFFVKNKKYWFETQYEETKAKVIEPRMKTGRRDTYSEKYDEGFATRSMERNMRAVWTITTKPFKKAHFATYPEALCETPLKAGCPEFVCNKCGKAREKMFEHIHKGTTKSGYNDGYGQGKHLDIPNQTEIPKQIGWSDCGCNAGFSGGVILDPFFGAGTTGLVALKQNKKFVGVELNKTYCDIATKRLEPYLSQKKIGDLL